MCHHGEMPGLQKNRKIEGIWLDMLATALIKLPSWQLKSDLGGS